MLGFPYRVQGIHFKLQFFQFSPFFCVPLRHPLTCTDSHPSSLVPDDLAHRGVSDSLSSEMHCGCCEQSQYVIRLLVCSTLYSFVFLLHLTLLQGHKLLWYWKYLNIKISRTFFFSCHLHSNLTQWKWWDCGKNGLFEWQVFMCVPLEGVGQVLIVRLACESCARCYSQSLRKISRSDVWQFSLCYSLIWYVRVFVSAAAGLFHHSHLRNDGRISVRGRWISRLYSLQIFPLNSQSAIPRRLLIFLKSVPAT